MQVHLQLMLVCGVRQLQLFLAENRLECRSAHFEMQVTTLRCSSQDEALQRLLALSTTAVVRGVLGPHAGGADQENLSSDSLVCPDSASNLQPLRLARGGDRHFTQLWRSRA